MPNLCVFGFVDGVGCPFCIILEKVPSEFADATPLIFLVLRRLWRHVHLLRVVFFEG